MYDFIFKKENNVFVWENEFLSLQFSNPYIQSFFEYLPLKTLKDIMYFHYDFKIFKKVKIYDDFNNEQIEYELLTKIDTYDYPNIIELKNIIEYFLSNETLENSQKVILKDKRVVYKQILSSETIGCDDFYEITKMTFEKDKSVRYIVYAGVSQNDTLDTIGIRTPYVSKQDLEKLLQCVQSFIEYAIVEHNDCLEKNKYHFVIQNNKIYQYEVLNGVLNKEEIYNIHCLNELITIITVNADKQTEIQNVIITDIKDEYVYLNNHSKININHIVNIFNMIHYEKLYYTQNQVVNDMLDLLSNEEKEEFRNKKGCFLLKKYKNVIINRTWLCREEHNLPNINYKGDVKILIIPIVNDIISQICNRLK